MFKNSVFNFYSIKLLLIICILTLGTWAFSQEFKNDSVHTRNLKTVTVNGQRLQTARAALPIQLFTEKEITKLNASNVSDIAKHFAGVTVKDYGGIGGLKTVSIRGLGAQQTGVNYDGVMMSDIQCGQIDLGRISIENVSEISLNNGQTNDIFQSARTFSSSSVICITSQMPKFNEKHSLSGKISTKIGSFGLVNANINLTKNFNNKLGVNLSTDALLANGKYKFLQNLNSSNSNGITEELTRTNSDVKSSKSELNVNYDFRAKEHISLKMNHFISNRGLPGGVILYNPYSVQRLLDKTFFAQIHYENKISPKFQHQYFAKFNRSFNNFEDSLSLTSNNYLQKEYYLSSSFQTQPFNPLYISLSADWWYNDLEIDFSHKFENFAFPTRNSGLINIATKYLTERLTIGANLLYTLTRENVKVGVAAPNRNKLSPAASISYKLLTDKELRIRAFYKNIFRLPTFNELYYQEMGNHNLRPEKTNQYNVGLIYNETEIPLFSDFEFNVDGYYNQVVDKIIATPRDLFHWSMVNKGKVDIIGLDVNLKASIKLSKTDYLHINGNYSYQSATDVTLESATYGEQIQYTPFHSGSSTISYSHNWFEGGYNMLFSGKRWSGQNTKSNRLEAYVEHSIFTSATVKQFKLTGEIINILNTQYEVVQFYPMPRRNFRVTVSLKF